MIISEEIALLEQPRDLGLVEGRRRQARGGPGIVGRARLHELIDRWRYRTPDDTDTDPKIDIFSAVSWQYVLYGMGFRTDLSERAGTYRFFSEARAEFEDIKRQAANAAHLLPTNRALIQAIKTQNFRTA